MEDAPGNGQVVEAVLPKAVQTSFGKPGCQVYTQTMASIYESI